MERKLQRKIILDTDLGDDIDDAFALRYLLALEQVEILGITTVYKNVVERAKIAKRFLDLYESPIKVFAGETKPFFKNVRLLYGEYVREDGLIKIDHYTQDLDSQPYDGDNGIDFILETLKKYPHEITLVAIGPLTNLAKCAQKDMETFRLAKELLIMGGRFQDKIAEWNIETDPHAAQIVISCGVPCKIIPFDITNLCSIEREGVERVRALQKPVDCYLSKMMDRWIEHYDDNWRGEKIPVLHDVLAVMPLEDETMFQTKEIRFNVYTEGENADCTIECEDGKCQATLYYQFDKAAFYRNFWEKLEKE